jgi:ATP-dependent DNA helicase DinG
MEKTSNKDNPKLTPEQIAEKVMALTDKIFGPQGWLVTAKKWEHRPGQYAMAKAVAMSVTHDSSLVEEAPTGVGKSLAYLIPSILYAVLSGRKAVVSSHTINLQEQLEKDILLIREFFKEIPELKEFSDFKSATMLGRGNYLCGSRLKEVQKNPEQEISSEVKTELWEIMKWYQKTENGVRHELSPMPSNQVWSLVSADSSGCNPRGHCNPQTCYYCKAKNRVRLADIVILNHSLVFATIQALPKTPERGVLMANDFLILDEAHTVPEVATEHFGTNLYFPSITGQLKRLHNPSNPMSLANRHAPLRHVIPLVDQAEKLMQSLEDEVNDLFLDSDEKEVTFKPLRSLTERNLEIFNELARELARRADEGIKSSVGVMLRDFARRFQSTANDLIDFTKIPLPSDRAFWAEKNKDGKVRLRSAMLDVGPELKRTLFSRNTSIVCASATLAIGKDLNPFCRRIGASGVNTAQVKSPFNYRENMRFYVLTDCPEPRNNSEEDGRKYIADFVKMSIPKVTGGTLVLFTSYQLMQKVAKLIEPFCAKRGIPFGIQGGGESRTDLVSMMKTNRQSVLFGTSSFWTGVDIPGESLKHLVVTRLPFEVPNHPVAKARDAALRRAGRNSFMELSLNECVWRFRQGIGRLIRTATDQGILTVMDDRVLTKRYGGIFLESVPQDRFIKMNRSSWGDFSDPYGAEQPDMFDLAS